MTPEKMAGALTKTRRQHQIEAPTGVADGAPLSLVLRRRLLGRLGALLQHFLVVRDEGCRVHLLALVAARHRIHLVLVIDAQRRKETGVGVLLSLNKTPRRKGKGQRRDSKQVNFDTQLHIRARRRDFQIGKSAQGRRLTTP